MPSLANHLTDDQVTNDKLALIILTINLTARCKLEISVWTALEMLKD
jgi:hypothetical protein